MALSIDTNFVPAIVKPDYDKQVLAPLHAAQAAKAAEDARQKAIRDAEALAAQQEQQRQAQAVQATYTASVSVSAPSDVEASIVKWAMHYGVDPQWMLRIANCESGFRQSAVNLNYSAGGGNPSGIFQFLPQTFYGNGGTDYSSYDDQARVAAYMFSIGQSGQWACK